MSDETSATRLNIGAILLTGIVSLAVGVGSGVLINYLTENRPRLTYDITTQEVFPGEKNNIGIFALRVVNDGKEAIEELSCRLRFTEGEVTERRVTGISESTSIVNATKGEIDVSVPFLNPGEQFSIQALLTNLKQPFARPSIVVRGKGVSGTEAEPTQRSTERIPEIFSAITAAAATLMTAALFITLRTRRTITLEAITETITPTHHSADQRDTVAFSLETQGLSRDADEIRHWPRELTYWVASDMLCRKWILDGEPGHIRQGIEALKFLLDYAAVSDESKRIVQLNIAKAAEAIGEHALAKQHIVAAQKDKNPIIAKRIKADPSLRRLTTSQEG